VKFLRLLLSCLLLVIALAAVLVAAAFVPIVQTWIAQWALSEHPELKGSIGSFSAEFGKVEVTDLHLEADGVVLTLPSLEAALPLTTAARDRMLALRSVVAKGWVLDLRHAMETDEAPEAAAGTPAPAAEAAPVDDEDKLTAQRAARAFRGLWHDWRLPCAMSLDGVDLEGEVIVPGAEGKAARRVHVLLQGGGLAAEREGAFALDATSSFIGADYQMNEIAAHGRLRVALASPRSVQRVALTADLSAKGGWLPENLRLSADVAATHGAEGESYSLGLNRDDRRVATVVATYPRATRRLAGTWKVDLRDADLAPFFPDHPLPPLTAAGEGRFDAAPGFDDVHAQGQLKMTGSQLGVLAPPLERLGQATVETDFELDRRGNAVRVGRLSLSLTGIRPIAQARALQPFDFDLATGAFKLAEPGRDGMEILLQGLPLAWLAGPGTGITFQGGDATGAFVVRSADGGFTLRAQAPLTAAGVSVLSGGQVLAHGLDLSLSLLGASNSQGWQLEGQPITIASGGRRLATLSAKAVVATEADQPLLLTGKWEADLEALQALAASQGVRGIAGHSASGDFSVSTGSSTVADGNLTVVGRDSKHAVTASVQASVDADGAISFLAPIKLSTGTSASELSAEGSWTGAENGPQVQLKVTGENVSAVDLRLLAGPLAAATGALIPTLDASGLRATGAGSGARDRTPFWGQAVGSISVGFDRLRTASQELKNVGGTLDLAHGSLQLERGRAELPNHSVVTAEGSLSFDPSGPLPYALTGTASVDRVEASTWFPTGSGGDDPVVEGRFAVAGKLMGTGANLPDLARRMQEEVRLTSAGGILRLLKTSVADAITETPTPVKDALGSAGSLVAGIFGHKGYAIESGQNKLNPITEAVIDFTNQVSEISFDQLTVTALRRSDGTIRLTEISLVAPDERLTGSGLITGAPGRTFPSQPFSADLRLSVHGGIATLLSTTGLLSTHRDDLGYTLLSQPIHFGGTLEHIDAAAWHDLLAKAATQKPPTAK
jgi:hypothetical protein